MAKTKKSKDKAGAENQSAGCCNVETVVTIDERGQMVLPKDMRDKAGIKPGDRLAVISCCDSGGKVCCITMIKAEDLSGMVKVVLGPMMKDLQ